MQMSAQYLPSGHDHFFSNTFHFSSYCGVLTRLTIQCQLRQMKRE